VEGGGDELAVPILVSKQRGQDFQISCVDMGGKSNIVRLTNGFEQTVLRQKALGLLDFALLLDRDVIFPPYSSLQQEQDDMRQRCDILGRTENIRIRIFWAIRMFESWVIGGLAKGDRFCGLSPKLNKPIPGDTQSFPEEPKIWLTERLEDGRYNSRVLVCLTRQIRLDDARRRNKSLRDFLDGL